jgi:hypothetical protein
MSTEQTPTTPWHVTACVHQPITPTQADGLFDTLADAAHGWEPAGVDVDVSGGPCYCRESPAAVARVVDVARRALLKARSEYVRVADQHGQDHGPDTECWAEFEALAHAVDALDADADPATERDFDAAAAAAVPVTVVGTRPPWQVHEGPPPTHGTPAAAPPAGPGWDHDTIADLARCLRTFGYAPLTPGAGMVADQLDALLADWNRLHTWHGLMSVLDQHYPPNVPLGPDSDPGPRILALTRALDAARAEVATLTAERDRLRGDRIVSVVMGHHRGAPRPFALYRRSDSTGISGTGVVAEGCAFNDGSAVLRWLSDWPTSVVFHDRGIEAIEKIHGHSGATQVVWMSDELQPLAEMEQERDQARAELADARRDAAADALLMVRQRFEESTDGDGNIDTGWWLRWLEAWAAEVRTGQRTINPQSATTPDDLPEWERDIVFPATDTTEEP